MFKRLHDSRQWIREMGKPDLENPGPDTGTNRPGRLIFSPKPEQRLSVVPLLKDRTDVDPVIWSLSSRVTPWRWSG